MSHVPLPTRENRAFRHEGYSCEYSEYAATDKLKRNYSPAPGSHTGLIIQCIMFCIMKLLERSQNWVESFELSTHFKQTIIYSWGASSLYRRGKWSHWLWMYKVSDIMAF
jgi:hypothetical protein